LGGAVITKGGRGFGFAGAGTGRTSTGGGSGVARWLTTGGLRTGGAAGGRGTAAFGLG
jgi:hypothetical protein